MLSDEINAAVPLKEWGQIKALGVFAGRKHIEQTYPQLSEAAIEWFISVLFKKQLEAVKSQRMVQDKQTSTNYDPNRPMFVTVAWLLGASQNQLGMYFGVTQGTILAKLNKVLRYETDRTNMRLVQPPITPSNLSLIHDTYYEQLSSNPKAFDGMTPLEIARAIAGLIAMRDVGEDPYATEPDVKSRFGEAAS